VKHTLLLFILVLGLASATATGAEPQHVNAFNFARAESDLYFSNLLKKSGGLGVLFHDRTPTPIDKQVIVRMNRDTLYSSSVHDLAAGAVKVTMPRNSGGRFQSLQVISQDHYSPFVIYDGTLELTQKNVGTRYVLLAFRTFVNPTDKSDIEAAHALQDAIKVEQAKTGSFEIPSWDKKSRDEVRKSLASLQSLGGTDDKVRMGRNASEVDPVAHLMATATGWGLNPKSAAMYFTVYPERNDGKTVHRLVLRDVPVDGFWSISVYNKDGYFEKNEFDAYSLNNVTAKKDADGTVTIQFGGCDGKTPNCLPIADDWNYSLRLYRPRAEVLDGRWTPAAPKPVASK
jgi:hypothetical protein